MPTTKVATIPGNGYSKIVAIDLNPEDACKVCGAFPEYEFWLDCFTCWLPVCYHCAVQWADGHFCPSCARNEQHLE